MLLRDKDKVRLNEIFSSVEVPMEVWAFGSRVSGAAHEGSDLDLVIRTQNLEKLPMVALTELKDKIKHSNIPIVVELFDWARLPKSFHANIKARFEVFFSNCKTVVNEMPESYKSPPEKRS